MTEIRKTTNSRIVDISDLSTEFVSLRIGESVAGFKIRQLRKLVNQHKTDNLPGTDYKYLLEDESSRILIVNAWTLWKKIASTLREAGNIQVTLSIKHIGFDDYSVKVEDKQI